MTIKIDISNNIILSAAGKVSAICNPLKQLDISYFRYGKLFKDGSRIILTNKPELSQFCYEEKLYPFTWYDSEKSISAYDEGYKFWAIERLSDDSKQAQVGKEIKRLFQLTDGVCYLKKNKNFLEIFDFSANHSNIYYTNQQILHRFMFYFKEQARSLIIGAESEKILVPLQQTQAANINDEREGEFIQETPIKRYYLHSVYGDVYFTAREIDCLNWCVKGKTAEETALLLGIKKRTVEKNLETIKRKTNCFKQIQLTSFAIKHGLLTK